jgi:hypothetical protein
MAEPFLIKKAVDISIPAVGKSVSMVLKGVIFIGFFAALIWAVYLAYIKPHFNPIPTRETHQTAEVIDNTEVNYYAPDEQFFIGVKIFGIKMGISKDKRQKITKETTQNVKPVKVPANIPAEKK